MTKHLVLPMKVIPEMFGQAQALCQHILYIHAYIQVRVQVGV